MPEYIEIPKGVITGNDLIKHVSELKNISYEEARLLVMSPGDLSPGEFHKNNNQIIGRDGDVCAIFKIEGANRRVRNGIYFRVGQVVALRTPEDAAKPVSSKLDWQNKRRA